MAYTIKKAEILEILESIKENSLSFINSDEDEIWIKDVQCLNIVIPFIEKYYTDPNYKVVYSKTDKCYYRLSKDKYGDYYLVEQIEVTR